MEMERIVFMVAIDRALTNRMEEADVDPWRFYDYTMDEIQETIVQSITDSNSMIDVHDSDIIVVDNISAERLLNTHEMATEGEEVPIP